jgi:hypothetical protein
MRDAGKRGSDRTSSIPHPSSLRYELASTSNGDESDVLNFSRRSTQRLRATNRRKTVENTAIPRDLEERSTARSAIATLMDSPEFNFGPVYS